jgi:hypothetical protein
MKGRMAVIAAGVGVLALLTGVGPARADFHGACTPGSSPTAKNTLQLSGSTLTYTGLVNCVGRDVRIASLVFTAVDGTGVTTVKLGPVACTACTGPISLSGTYTVAGAGEYSLSMDFFIGAAERFRTQRAYWTGSGGLVTVCGGGDAANQQNFCPVPEATAAGAIPSGASALLPELPHDGEE